MKNIHTKIRDLRNNKNYKQQHLADHLGVSQKQYSRLESGLIAFNTHHLEKLCEILEVPIDYFFSPNIHQENNHQSGGVANIAETIVNHQSPKAFEQVLKNQEKTIELLQQLIGKG